MPITILCYLFFSKRLRKLNRRCRRACRRFVKSTPFYWTVIVMVFLNTCVLTSEHYKQPEFLDQFQGEKTVCTCSMPTTYLSYVVIHVGNTINLLPSTLSLYTHVIKLNCVTHICFKIILHT